MGAPQEIVTEIFTLIEGGTEIGTSAEIIPFPSDAGGNTFNVVEKTFQSSNGTGLNYWVAAVASGASALSAGALMITCTFPEFVALAAPCLGIAVGTLWYNMDPEFWEDVSDEIIEGGYTINGKVVSWMNTDGNLTFPREVLRILADKLLDAGVYDPMNYQIPEAQQDALHYPGLYNVVNLQYGIDGVYRWLTHNYYGYYELSFRFENLESTRPVKSGAFISNNIDTSDFQGGITPFVVSDAPFEVDAIVPSGTTHLVSHEVTRNDITYHIAIPSGAWGWDILYSTPSYYSMEPNSTVGGHWKETVWDAYYIYNNGENVGGNEELLQQGATYPQADVPWGDLYPEWIPWEFPTVTTPGGDYQLPDGLPVEYPDLLPIEQPYQLPAQDPNPNVEDNPETVVETIQDPNHNPNHVPGTDPGVNTDPEPGSEPDDITQDDPNPSPDPINPDPVPVPSPAIPVPNLPSTVSSNKLFTVYNPTSGQLDSLGGYLWDNSLIETLKKIWQNPLDGIIGLSQIYCTPSTGSSHNIILGYLDSGVSSAVVTSQFTSIDCGTVALPEQNNNVTDYNPYTSIQIYLPFIGITELNVNEFMGGSVSVKYHIDVYTGSCLAEVSVTRTPDVPNSGIIYTFNGNCSQQLPLTSGDQKGLLTALIGAAGVGIGIASGGATFAGGLIAGEISRDVNREMMHVSHSGNLSANAGIMGQKKPYLIINRRKPYNANNYNKMYGYPTNKTVYLGNCTGFTKVQSGRLRSSATDQEKSEIMELLMKGVIM